MSHFGHAILRLVPQKLVLFPEFECRSSLGTSIVLNITQIKIRSCHFKYAILSHDFHKAFHKFSIWHMLHNTFTAVSHSFARDVIRKSIMTSRKARRFRAIFGRNFLKTHTFFMKYLYYHMIKRIWNVFSFHTVFMKRVVCFISPRQRLGDIKHTTRFINTVRNENSFQLLHLWNISRTDIGKVWLFKRQPMSVSVCLWCLCINQDRQNCITVLDCYIRYLVTILMFHQYYWNKIMIFTLMYEITSLQKSVI